MAQAAPSPQDLTAPPAQGRGRPRVVDALRDRFRQRLRWRLTASYALVTVAVLAAIEVALLLVGALVLVVALGRNGDTVVRDLEERAVPEVAPLLAGVPDVAGVDRWLRHIQANGIVGQGEGPIRVRPDASVLADAKTHLLVVDRVGRLVGEVKQPAAPTTLALPAGVDPRLAEAVAAALSGRASTTRLLRWPLPRRLTVAVPVRDDRGVVVGALVFGGRLPLGASLAVLGHVLLAIAAGVIVVGATIGTVSGYLAARSLVTRFDRMSSAAAAWGAGDFSAAVFDGGEDEIGLLGRRLNRMAERLPDLIRAREQLSVVDERNRLARDLHDSVKQQAFAVSMHLGAARELWARRPDDARHHLDTAYDIARQSQRELTTIIQTLRPTELAQDPLDLALNRYVAEWRAQTGIAIAADIPPVDPLADAIEDALFRITQEALANVARHSRASRVDLALRRVGTGWLLEIVDDGTGFDVGRARRGVGLQSMRERAAALGGTVDVASVPEGTRISVRLPDADPGVH